MKKISTIALSFVMALTFLLPAKAQAEWPDRPVKMILGSQAGSSIDIVGRLLAQALSEKFGQPFVPNNITSGGLGAFAMTMKNANPDGYTIGFGADQNFSYGVLDKNARYTLDDFIFLAAVFYGDSTVICSSEKPWKTLKEAFEWAKANNETLDYLFQTPLDRMWMQIFAKNEGVKLKLIPATGPSAIITSLMGGHADLGYSGGFHFEQERAGKVRSIMVSGANRSKAFPHAPTKDELFSPAYGYNAYRIALAPKGFPKEAQITLEAAIKEIVTSPKFIEQVNKLQFIPDYMSSTELTENIKSQLTENKIVIELTTK